MEYHAERGTTVPERHIHRVQDEHGLHAPKRNDTRARLEKVLAELPERVQAYLEDLEILLARRQIERGRTSLPALALRFSFTLTGFRFVETCAEPWEFTLLVAPRGFEPLFRP